MIIHFRGCSGEPNHLQRIYHSSETKDSTYFLHCLQREWGTAAPLDAAVSISAPLALEPCSQKLDVGFSRFYQHYLLTQLKKNATRKLRAFRRLREFDDAITARAHGFIDARDYYLSAPAPCRC